jgi:hypothetical protein
MICFVFNFSLHYVFLFHQCVLARIRPLHSSIDMTRTSGIKAKPASVQGVYVHMDFASPYRKSVRNSSARFVRILARKYGALNVRCTQRIRFCASYISSFKTLFFIVGCIMLSFERIWFSMGVLRHPASYPMGTRDSFRRVKRPGRETDQSTASSAEV